MKRVWRISDAAQAQLFLHTRSAKPKTLIPQLCAQTPPSPNPFPRIINLLSNNWKNSNARAREDLCAKISHLRDELLDNIDNGDEIARILEEKTVAFLSSISPRGVLTQKLLSFSFI
ncbi:hypothetical protein Acr_17g0002330 [Actinidia rufa]|uniref:Uncharacterized protein n=1 Tax=Actinidia rufa TaxID=165716 RepID=A0A7J0G1K5_9ERIC|nr:hypothetical protein Acr_17g0002330 [Actinidia rufa]